MLALPLSRNPAAGLAMAMLLWALALVLHGAEPLARANSGPDALFALAADALYLLVTLLAAALMIHIARPDVIRDNVRVGMLCLIAAVSLAVGKGIHSAATQGFGSATNAVRFLMPAAMAPLLATILADGVVAMAVGLWCAFAFMVFAGRQLDPLIAGLIATIVAAAAARNLRTRSGVVRIGLVIGLCETACVFTAATVEWRTANVLPVLNQAGACVLSGFASAILVLLLLPLFELIFRTATPITLLELSDLSHPLLQRLALEAPGTYHHSLVVANLGSAAADEIGADALAVRVGAYFHDVGKLTKPDFFSENMDARRNPHDDLPPSMSTLIIAAHVKEGLSLALLHKLPDAIMRIIAEHHGTSLMSCFHHKAMNLGETGLPGAPGASPAPEARVNDADFRYPGPRPSSRESAIICLADAAEAASRSLEKFSPTHIEDMVDDITFARVRDGQLDASNLTMADIARVRRSFVFTLSNMLHARVPYPRDENRDKQPPKAAKGRRSEGRGAGPLADGERVPSES